MGWMGEAATVLKDEGGLKGLDGLFVLPQERTRGRSALLLSRELGPHLDGFRILWRAGYYPITISRRLGYANDNMFVDVGIGRHLVCSAAIHRRLRCDESHHYEQMRLIPPLLPSEVLEEA